MTTKAQLEKQRTEPDGDFDFKGEDQPDNTSVPVGRPDNSKKAKARKAAASDDVPVGDTADTDS